MSDQDMVLSRDELALVLGWYADSHSTGDANMDAASDELADRFKDAYQAAVVLDPPPGHHTP